MIFFCIIADVVSIDIPPAKELNSGKIVLIFCQDTSLVNLYAILAIGSG